MTRVLDMTAGARMMWVDREDDRAVTVDMRRPAEHTLCDGRSFTLRPDIVADFRALPFADASFDLVVFDPPHLRKAGPQSWMRTKYGVLDPDTWRDDIHAGFGEAFRVSTRSGTVIFKWAETQIPLSQIIPLAGRQPLFGHPSGKRGGTHWVTFEGGVR